MYIVGRLKIEIICRKELKGINNVIETEKLILEHKITA